MAKKSSGKHYVSQGKHRNVAKSTLRAMRADRTGAEKMANIQNAWLKGQNPWITIENPNKEDTSRRFIRVRVNDLNHGTARERDKKSFSMG